jgi:hypothetical protein
VFQSNVRLPRRAETGGQLQLAVRADRDHIGGGNESWLRRRFLPESRRVHCRGLTDSGFQAAMARAHSPASRVGRHAWEQATQPDRGSKLATLVEGGAGGGCLRDDEHPRSMGTRARADK